MPPSQARHQVISRVGHSSLSLRLETTLRVLRMMHLGSSSWVNTVAPCLRLRTESPGIAVMQQGHRGVRFVTLFLCSVTTVSMHDQKSSRKPGPQTSELKVSLSNPDLTSLGFPSIRPSRNSQNLGLANGSKETPHFWEHRLLALWLGPALACLCVLVLVWLLSFLLVPMLVIAFKLTVVT